MKDNSAYSTMSYDVNKKMEVSYLIPRDPSLMPHNRRYMRVERPVPLNFTFQEDEEERKWQNVFLRIKPTTALLLGSEGCPFSVLDEHTFVAKIPKHTSAKPLVHQFTFTKIFGPEVNQGDLYHDTGLPSLEDFINGDNCLLFAYGASNAGKTHTIQGDIQRPGIIPHSINILFNTIQCRINPNCRYKPEKVGGVVELNEEQQHEELSYKRLILKNHLDRTKTLFSTQSKATISNMTQESEDYSDTTTSNIDFRSDFISNTFQDIKTCLNTNTAIDISKHGDVLYSVWVSYAEIYNECPYDLLVLPSENKRRQQLTIGETLQKDVFIKGLRHINVMSGDEAYAVFLYGQHNLQLASTNINPTSSRSHSIFSIKLIRHANVEDPLSARISTFSFVDLAGVERAAKTQNVGDRMKESQNINTSLHVLGRCLETIRSNQHSKDKKIIPFRDSKLTRLFQQALNGKERVTMIVNMNIDGSVEENLNVLKFSAIAKQIVFQHFVKPRRPFVRRTSRLSRVEMQAKKQRLSRSPTMSGTSSTNSHLENLLAVIEEQKLQLAEQRENGLMREKELRHEIVEKYSSILKETETTWQNRLKAREEGLEEFAEWSVNNVKEYYEQQIKDLHNNKVDERVKNLEEENKWLEEELQARKDLLAEVRKDHQELEIKYSKLSFNLSATETELIETKKLLEVSEAKVQQLENRQPSITPEQSITDRDFLEKEIIRLQKENQMLLNSKSELEKRLSSNSTSHLEMKKDLEVCAKINTQMLNRKSRLIEEEGIAALINTRALRDRLDSTYVRNPKVKRRRMTRSQRNQIENIHPSLGVINETSPLDISRRKGSPIKLRKKLYSGLEDTEIEPIDEEPQFIPVAPGIITRSQKGLKI